jgi:hypothetical protein
MRAVIVRRFHGRDKWSFTATVQLGKECLVGLKRRKSNFGNAKEGGGAWACHAVDKGKMVDIGSQNIRQHAV